MSTESTESTERAEALCACLEGWDRDGAPQPQLVPQIDPDQPWWLWRVTVTSEETGWISVYHLLAPRGLVHLHRWLEHQEWWDPTDERASIGVREQSCGTELGEQVRWTPVTGLSEAHSDLLIRLGVAVCSLWIDLDAEIEGGEE